MINSQYDNSAFDAFEKRLKNFRRDKFQDLVALVLRRLVAECFEYSKDPEGRRWQKLKKRIGQILVDKSNLKNSITHINKRNSIFIGSNSIYSGTHQNGFLPKNIPARPYLPKSKMPEKWQKEVEEEARAYIKDVLKL